MVTNTTLFYTVKFTEVQLKSPIMSPIIGISFSWKEIENYDRSGKGIGCTHPEVFLLLKYNIKLMLRMTPKIPMDWAAEI